jgi:hypothetical protein
MSVQVSADVTAINAVGSSTASASAHGPVILRVTLPVNINPPQIGGLPTGGVPFVGTTLTATGTWTGTPTPTFDYQWLAGGRRCRCERHQLPAYDGRVRLEYLGVGNRINIVGSVSVTSPSTPAVALNTSPPVNTILPQVFGLPGSGQTNATSGSWNGNPTPTYTYQWSRAPGAPVNATLPAVSGHDAVTVGSA